MASSKGEVILLWKPFPILRKTPPAYTEEKFGPGNPIFIAWFVNENKNKT